MRLCTGRFPIGERWLHEIKHDGVRVIARKDGKRVQLYSRQGNVESRAQQDISVSKQRPTQSRSVGPSISDAVGAHRFPTDWTLTIRRMDSRNCREQFRPQYIRKQQQETLPDYSITSSARSSSVDK